VTGAGAVGVNVTGRRQSNRRARRSEAGEGYYLTPQRAGCAPASVRLRLVGGVAVGRLRLRCFLG
jgi:hypothetical protein